MADNSKVVGRNVRFQWALKWRERERKVGENRFEYSRHAYASLSDTFNNFNPWFKYGERLASPRTKVGNGGSLPPFYDLLSPHLFSRSQIRTINSHGDGIQLKEAIPTSPLSGLSLESLLSLLPSLCSFHILRVSHARPAIIEHVEEKRRIEEISFTRMKTLPGRIHYYKNNLYLFLYRSDNELYFGG